jgi:uncharacterized membrane protein
MGKSRLEAFSDGVLAIILTIMVLEMKVPHGDPSLNALHKLWGVFLSYVLSFVYIGIYWNNHHHLLHTVRTVSAGVLWANLHLLFWLSLVPFTTGWMGENHFAPIPTALYGVNLLMAALAYTILTRAIIAAQGPDSLLRKAVGSDRKGLLSLLIYAIAIATACVAPQIAGALYAIVAITWLIPDRRIERVLTSPKGEPPAA